jgi:hypothetical protein
MLGLLRAYFVVLIPLGLALIAMVGFSLLGGNALFSGICSKCGENLPHRGFVRCPWCGRICLVLWYR